jgi:preprotein translocase subunit SecD
MSADPGPSVSPRPSVWFWLLPFAAAVLGFGGIVLWLLTQSVPGTGIELGYRIAVPSAPELETTARRRLGALDIPGSGVRVEQDLLILKLPGATAETAARVKRIFRPKGLLQLSMAAPIPVQEQFNKDKAVPEGYKAVVNSVSSRGGNYDAYDGQMLVRKEPVIEGRHIANAEPRQEMVPSGARWVTAFEMNAEGARLFDEAAEKLYNMRPPGLIAILFDGVLRSAPAVQSPTFHGRAQISGAKDAEDAKELAIILRTGALPVPLGEPEFERPYGPKK